MTIDFANNLRMSFGLSFDEVISILGLHYGKTEWVVDDEIHQRPQYEDMIEFLSLEDGNNSQAASDIINHLRKCKADRGIAVRYGKIPKSDIDRVKRWFKAGYTPDDFKAVNAYFVEEWAGTDNQQYLVPATLYKGGDKGWNFPAKVDIATASAVGLKPNIDVL